MENQSKNIESSVGKLESLFDRLYADTFSMMKDTVSDMRKQLWSNPSKSTDETNYIKKKEIEEIVRNSLGTELKGENNIDKIVKEIEEKLNKIAFHTKDPQREAVVLEAIKKLSPISFGGLVKKMAIKESSIVGDIFELRNRGIITWNGSDDELGRENIISIVDSDINLKKNE
ncbi:MAG: hypothetical protein BCS36_01660 [Desulfovibrio sp. MES5]|nr:MAG: hypothetical protein BCS36_01660 [Desulfovibrio sp. MES5]